MSFTLALAQTRHPAHADGVLELVDRHAAQAAAAGAALVVFPESLMSRFEAEKSAFVNAAQTIDGPFAQGVNAIAAKHGLWIVYTMNERNEAGLPFNTLAVANAQGEQVAVYRKLHLFDSSTVRESSRMSAGNAAPPVVAAPFARLGLGICYDLRFPELTRRNALGGAQLQLFPAAWVAGPSKAFQWKTLLTARAIENGMFVAGLSRCDEGYLGCSAVIAPNGDTIAEAGEDEGLLLAEVDLSLIDEASAKIPVLSHVRRDIYRYSI